MFAAHRCGVGDVGEGIPGGGNGLCRAGEAEGDTAAHVCLDSLDRTVRGGSVCMVKSSWALGEG